MVLNGDSDGEIFPFTIKPNFTTQGSIIEIEDGWEVDFTCVEQSKLFQGLMQEILVENIIYLIILLIQFLLIIFLLNVILLKVRLLMEKEVVLFIILRWMCFQASNILKSIEVELCDL